MDSADGKQRLIDAWLTAGRALGIRVVAPFALAGDDGPHACIAWLPDFGGPNGMLLQAVFPPDFVTDKPFGEDARKAGYFVSFISAESYATFRSDKFRDALADWGFYGDTERRPAWIAE